MPVPSIAIDLDIIADNTRSIARRCAEHGTRIFGVTKATCGSPLAGRAMLRGGAVGLGESRIDNVRRRRRGGLTCPIMMPRIPSATAAPEVVRLCDISLNSETAVLHALSVAAQQRGVTHDVIVMLEMGDRREGATADELLPLCGWSWRRRGCAWPGSAAANAPRRWS